jgi:hypothetical protein
MNNENKPKLHLENFSGSISIYDYKPRQGCKEIIINSEWVNGVQYFIISNDVDYLVVQKCYMEIPKNALKISKQNHLRIEIEAPNGTFEICTEESTEDELVVYYR